MVKIKNLLIINTPFHLKVLINIFAVETQSQDTLVLSNELVNTSKLLARNETIPKYVFSRKKLFKSPLKQWNQTRREVQNVKKDVCNLINSYDFSKDLNIIICSDKDIFTQILIESLRTICPQKKLIAVEEGLGFYMRLTFNDTILSYIYKILTPFLFNIRLYYIRRLGSHPEIDVIYVRALDLLPKGLSGLNKYKTFQLDCTKEKSKIKDGKCLFYSFPEQDYGLSRNVKLNLILFINKQISAYNKELFIKPHPREEIDWLKQQLKSFENITFLDKSLPGEDINYFDFELIINFFSSIILDIIHKKYPKNKVLTIGIWKKPRVSFDFNLKYYSLKKFKNTNIFKENNNE